MKMRKEGRVSTKMTAKGRLGGCAVCDDGKEMKKKSPGRNNGKVDRRLVIFLLEVTGVGGQCWDVDFTCCLISLCLGWGS